MKTLLLYILVVGKTATSPITPIQVTETTPGFTFTDKSMEYYSTATCRDAAIVEMKDLIQRHIIPNPSTGKVFFTYRCRNTI